MKTIAQTVLTNKYRLSLWLLLLLPCSLQGQHIGLELKNGSKEVEIPFEYENKFIIINVLFKNILPLRFILDTGAENTILTKRQVADILNVSYEKEISIMGADMKTELIAMIARRIKLSLTNASITQDIIVLGDDYFKFDQFTGTDIHGILGAEVFRGYVVKINYVKKVLTIIDPSEFDEPDPKKYTRVPISLIRNKPYINAKICLLNDTCIQTRLLLDTGAGLSLLLHTNTSPSLVLPEHTIPANIGIGLGGNLEGYLGRIKSISLSNFSFRNIYTNFQDIRFLVDTSFLNGRNGIIGNDILSRFNVIFHFGKEMLYLQPNSKFKDDFSYDKSGLVVAATGTFLTDFIINDVLPNTPGYEAGLRKGDQILRINGIFRSFLTLGSINHKLQGKVGKKICIVYKRDGKKYKAKFVLRDII